MKYAWMFEEYNCHPETCNHRGHYLYKAVSLKKHKYCGGVLTTIDEVLFRSSDMKKIEEFLKTKTDIIEMFEYK